MKATFITLMLFCLLSLFPVTIIGSWEMELIMTGDTHLFKVFTSGGNKEVFLAAMSIFAALGLIGIIYSLLSLSMYETLHLKQKKYDDLIEKANNELKNYSALKNKYHNLILEEKFK
jgi:hypothetical protein